MRQEENMLFLSYNILITVTKKHIQKQCCVYFSQSNTLQRLTFLCIPYLQTLLLHSTVSRMSLDDVTCVPIRNFIHNVNLHPQAISFHQNWNQNTPSFTAANWDHYYNQMIDNNKQLTLSFDLNYRTTSLGNKA